MKKYTDEQVKRLIMFARDENGCLGIECRECEFRIPGLTDSCKLIKSPESKKYEQLSASHASHFTARDIIRRLRWKNYARNEDSCALIPVCEDCICGTKDGRCRLRIRKDAVINPTTINRIAREYIKEVFLGFNEKIYTNT